MALTLSTTTADINMLLIIYIALSIIPFVGTNGDEPYCPPERMLSPCTCKDSVIYCGGQQSIDMNSVFKTLSEYQPIDRKHFVGFLLNNTSINELTGNQFKDITFDEIDIVSALSLERIDANAFTKTDLVTKYINIDANPKLSERADSSLFRALKKFVSIKSIYLTNNNITQIPDNAFGPQSNLSFIRFKGKSIHRLGRRAFKHLDSLVQLDIHDTSICHVPDHAFELDKKTDMHIRIDLFNNIYINSNSFEANALDYIPRPSRLDIGVDRDLGARTSFSYLPYEPFFRYLFYNEESSIKLSGHLLDCNDCRNYWLIKSENSLQTRVLGLKCTNDKPFTDESNFANCRVDSN